MDATPREILLCEQIQLLYERSQELETALRAVIPEDPRRQAYEGRDGSWYTVCAYCQQRAASRVLPLYHADDCPWLRARALLDVSR